MQNLEKNILSYSMKVCYFRSWCKYQLTVTVDFLKELLKCLISQIEHQPGLIKIKFDNTDEQLHFITANIFVTVDSKNNKW